MDATQEHYVVEAQGGPESSIYRSPNRVYLPVGKYLTPEWFDAQNFIRNVNRKVHRHNTLKMLHHHETWSFFNSRLNIAFALRTTASWMYGLGDEKWAYWAYKHTNAVFLADKINRRYDHDIARP